jgi:hypothetical protein
MRKGIRERGEEREEGMHIGFWLESQEERDH